MSQSIVLELDREADGYCVAGREAATADGWSSRRKLFCVAGLSVAAWLAVLSPLLIW